MDLMAIAGISLQNDAQRLATVSQNLANVLTPGYKRQITLSGAFDSQLAAASSLTSLELATLNSQPAAITIDASPGVLRYSGNAQEVALEGDAFFEVLTPSGSAYSRQGKLHVDLQGRLVGENGFPMLGMGGEIKLNNSPFSIAANGDVLQGEHIAGRLKRVQFENPNDLLPRGAGLYDLGAARIVQNANPPLLRVGFQEHSNVNSSQEMVRLSETVRHFESMQKIVQGYDDTLEKVIRKLGEF